MAQPKEVTVEIILHPGSNPPFELQSSLPMGPNGELVFINDHFPGFIVNFHLKAPTQGYFFPEASIPNNLKEALYSAKGAGCPNTPGQWGQFKATDVVGGGTTLVVRNPNQSKDQFGYTMRVTNDQGKSYLSLDPGGLNQNGPSSRLSLAAVFVAGAVAGSLLTLGTEAVLAR